MVLGSAFISKSGVRVRICIYVHTRKIVRDEKVGWVLTGGKFQLFAHIM